MHSISRFIRHAFVCVGLLLAITAQNLIAADSTPFTHVYAFGDSLSDAGRFCQLSGGAPPPPYFEGRFSNGKVWTEYLVEGLGMQFVAADDYAVGGAMTGCDNYRDGFAGQEYPGLQDQVTTYTQEHPAADASGALFVVWAGANDFFYALENGVAPAVLIQNGVVNTLTAVQRLWATGARQIVVVDVPDLGVTPFALSIGAGANITALAGAYNQTLTQGLDALDQAGITTIRISSFSTMQGVVENADSFGLANVTTPLLGLSADPNSYLFWDSVHPTTRGHEILAQAALKTLVSYYSPAQSDDVPSARAHSLNGLVRASPTAR